MSRPTGFTADSILRDIADKRGAQIALSPQLFTSRRLPSANTGLARALEALAEKKIAGRDGDLVWLCGEPLPGEAIKEA